MWPADDRYPLSTSRSVLQRARGPAGGAARSLPLLAQHATEQAPVQRGPGDHADAVIDRGREHLQLYLPGHQVVDGLLADQAEEPARGGGVIGLRDVPAGE